MDLDNELESEMSLSTEHEEDGSHHCIHTKNKKHLLNFIDKYVQDNPLEIGLEGYDEDELPFDYRCTQCLREFLGAPEQRPKETH